MPATMRACDSCGHQKEQRRRFFPRLPSGRYGTTCKLCIGKARKRAARRDAARRKRQMDQIEKAAVDRFLQTVSWGGATVPHTAELLDALMGYFGGVNGLAAMFYKQYCDSKAGSSFRTKMLDTAARH